MNTVRTDSLTLVEQAPFALLVTVGEGNKPFARHVGPLVNIGTDIYFVTRNTSRKVGQLEKNPSVALHFQLPEQSLKGFKCLSVSGTTSRVQDETVSADIMERLGQKSPGFKKYVCEDTTKSWIVYKVKGELLEYTDLAKSTRPMTEVVKP